jgi:hypothetical protein
MIEIIELSNSTKDGKRFRITLNMDGKIKSWDFGSDVGETFIDHGDPVKRRNYLKRHLANAKERERIENCIPSPALFSADLLWGLTPDLTENIILLQKKFRAIDKLRSA